MLHLILNITRSTLITVKYYIIYIGKLTSKRKSSQPEIHFFNLNFITVKYLLPPTEVYIQPILAISKCKIKKYIITRFHDRNRYKKSHEVYYNRTQLSLKNNFGMNEPYIYFLLWKGSFKWSFANFTRSDDDLHALCNIYIF